MTYWPLAGAGVPGEMGFLDMMFLLRNELWGARVRPVT